MTDFEKSIEQTLKVNFPSDIIGWIDEYVQFTGTVSNIVNNKWVCYEGNMPNMRYGVIKKFGIGVEYGQPSYMSYSMIVRGVGYPVNIIGTNPNIISNGIDDLNDIHIPIASGTPIKISVFYPVANLTDTDFQTLKVWVRLKGWYY